jgi:hypothetical protein
VVVPVPPLATPRVPVTSEELSAMAALNKAPPLVLLTGRAALREEMVVEPLVVTVKSEELAPFLMSSTARLEAAEEVA